MSSSAIRRHVLVRRGLRLEYLTLGWNAGEAVVAVTAGLLAGSIALIGFGLDSVIECVSGAVLVWRLRSDADAEMRERVENRALRLVGASFLALAAYVAWDAVSALWQHERPEHSLPGVVLTAVSLIVMPVLARAKRRVAASLNSGAMHADSRQTDFCAYLSAITLAGLLLNALAGWWWADPAAALVMVPIVVGEGVEGVRGHSCTCHDGALAPSCECEENDACHE